MNAKTTASEEPPTKAERQLCYDARDKHWRCLDLNNEDEDRCKETRKAYASCCLPKWVEHFDRKYRFEKFKQRTDEQQISAYNEKKAKANA